MISLSDIQFVVVLYKCRLDESSTILSLGAALVKSSVTFKIDLYVHDNSPYRQEIINEYKLWNIVYRRDLQNGGLSRAYNEAASYAKSNGKKYLLLLDQDTTFPQYALEMYLSRINNNIDIKLFAPILKIKNGKIMSPCKYVNKWGKLIEMIDPGIHNLNSYVPVNSGLCISLEGFFKAGGYNEKVKLDGADFQFIERFKTRVGELFYVLDLVIDQDFSLFDTDIENILHRFRIFLTDVGNFERSGMADSYYYNRIAVIRTLKLFIQTKSIDVINYYLKYYLKIIIVR